MRQDTPPESLILRRRPPRRLVPETGALVHRGLGELRPRRLSYPKLAATALRQLAYRTPAGLGGASVLMPLATHDADLTFSLLRDLPDLTLGAAVFPGLLDCLHAPGLGRHGVVVLGDGETPRDDSHAALARSLAAHNPQIEQRLAQELLARGRDAEQARWERDPLVVEERPGKAVVLALGEQTLKLSGKRFQALAARPSGEPLRAPVEAPDGWGVAALVVADAAAGAGPAGGRALTLASLDVQLAGDAVTLDTGRILHRLADAWLSETAGFGCDAVRRMSLSVPWMAVASAIGEAFQSAKGLGPRLYYPDLVYGWQPFMTLVQFLYGAELPALFLGTGRFPEVHLVAVW